MKEIYREVEEMENLEDLVVEAKAGNKDAFSKLISYVHNDLYNIARSRLRNEDDCQDIVQDTILHAYVKLNTMKDYTHFKNWIVKILINRCNKFYKKSRKRDAIFEDYKRIAKTEDYINDGNLEFDNLIKSLDNNDKKIFKLYYEKELPIREIAKRLSLNQNTVKTHLSRGKTRLKKILKPTTMLIIMFVLLITSVTAVGIISLLKDWFNTKDLGINNDGILMAIENLDWYQDPQMDYITLDDKNKIKVDYVLMDEMNLSLVLDLYSEEDLTDYNNITLPGLKITNEKGDIIYIDDETVANKISRQDGINLIENKNNHFRFLLYFYTNTFPISEQLDITFSKLRFSKNSDICKTLESEIDFSLKLDDKFVNREYNSYISNRPGIEKAIISPTGFYGILELDKDISKYIETGGNIYEELLDNIVLYDGNGNKYNCYIMPFGNNSLSESYQYIIIANCNDMQNKKLKLSVGDIEYNLLELVN